MRDFVIFPSVFVKHQFKLDILADSLVENSLKYPLSFGLFQAFVRGLNLTYQNQHIGF